MASHNTGQPSAPPTPARLNPYSCLSCRGRRKKCDRVFPCANCRTLGVECLFVPRRPSTRQPASLAILDRVRHLENVIDHMQKYIDPTIALPLAINGSPPKVQKVQKNDKNEKNESSPHSISTESANEMASLDTEFGRLAMGNGRSRYMIGNYWASLDDEVCHCYPSSPLFNSPC